jgi:Barrel-sandwich domain of CusB or HlyD membrane-fusion/Carboxypeptidase Taq (M32) metallopeptidase
LTQPSTKLYAVADLSTVWVYAEMFQNDLGRVKVGNPASITVDAYPGETFPARVSFIWPEVDRETRRARVRLEIPNPQMKLLLGMYVDVKISVPLGDQLAIPASGVFQSGTRQIAFVDHGGGSFEPRDIELGVRAGDDFIVLKGLDVYIHVGESLAVDHDAGHRRVDLDLAADLSALPQPGNLSLRNQPASEPLGCCAEQRLRSVWSAVLAALRRELFRHQIFLLDDKAHPDIPREIATGKFDTLHYWLLTNIYQHGRKFNSSEVVMRAAGAPMTIKPYIAYLREKYGELYRLEA